MANCPETIEELEALEQFLTLCKRTLYETAQSKLQSGAAPTERQAIQQIAVETGRSFSTIDRAIQREKKRMLTASVSCELDEQEDSIPPYAVPHVARNTGENEWYTPPAFIEAAREVLGNIDLDPASSDIANEIVKADKYYTIENDGRNIKWEGKIWLNPPYATELINHFTYLLCLHFKNNDVTEAIVLVNNATETEWFGRLISFASAIVFPKTRVKFLDPQGRPGAPLQGQAIIYLGKNSQKFLQAFAKFGWSATIWNQ